MLKPADECCMSWHVQLFFAFSSTAKQSCAIIYAIVEDNNLKLVILFVDGFRVPLTVASVLNV
jgi:hypothetical protein